MKVRTTLVAVVGVVSVLLLGKVLIAHADDPHEIACSNKTLKGAYGLQRTGTTATGPVAAVGIISFDGEGNWTVTQSRSLNGIFNFDTTRSGTYEVAEDCSVKEFIDGQESARFVIIEGGLGFYSLVVTPGNTVYAVARKVHTREHRHHR
jgi:hypothetical protein